MRAGSPALRRVSSALRRLGRGVGAEIGRQVRRGGTATVPAGRRPGGPETGGSAGAAYDYAGPVRVIYAPEADGEPDPGEVVWTWVPFEEDANQGKDRPVVVVGTALRGRPGDLAVVMLSSRDHDGEQDWMLLGRGGWDRAGRVSSVRLDRVLAVPPGAVRREGARLDRTRFDRLATQLARRHGWH